MQSHNNLRSSYGAIVFGELTVPRRPTNLDNSMAGAYFACSRCGWGFFGQFFSCLSFSPLSRGWSGGAMVLGKLPVPGRPTYLDSSRTRANCACNRCGGGGALFGFFFSHLSFLFFFSLSLRDGPI